MEFKPDHCHERIERMHNSEVYWKWLRENPELCREIPQKYIPDKRNEQKGIPLLLKYQHRAILQADGYFRLRFSKESHKKALDGGHQVNIVALLKLINIDIQKFPLISEWLMGFPLNWTKLKKD